MHFEPGSSSQIKCSTSTYLLKITKLTLFPAEKMDEIFITSKAPNVLHVLSLS